MSGWEPGDLALRVRPVPPAGVKRTGIRQGGVYTVSSVVVTPGGLIGLRFVGITNLRGPLRAARSSGFIKITPGTDVQGFEEPRRVPIKEKLEA